RSPLICIHLFFFLLLPPPPTSTLFPYTTLFRSLLVSATVAGAQGLTINHDEVGCLVAGKYPKLQACFTPAGDVKQARVYFRAQGTPSWYFVDMKLDNPCFNGILPKPLKTIPAIDYYIEATDKSFATSRTAEFAPQVVDSAEACKK